MSDERDVGLLQRIDDELKSLLVDLMEFSPRDGEPRLAARWAARDRLYDLITER